MAASRSAHDGAHHADIAAGLPLRGALLCIAGDAALARCWRLQLADDHPGVRWLQAANGLDGVRLAKLEQPAFVLLDMQLPDIGGLEVVRRLNEPITQRRLRVVILTSDPLSMDVVKAMSLGAFEYWPHPLSPALLDAGVRRVLGGRRADPAHTLRGRRNAAPLACEAANTEW